MYYPISSRIDSLRHTRFIGREAERDLFIDALQVDRLTFHLLFIYGPGGIGKTELINEFISICRLSQIMPIYMDSRNIEPAPLSFLANLAMKLGSKDEDPIQLMASSKNRFVVFVDAYDTMVPIDSWFRENLLPQLSENVMLVFSSQNTPAAAWFTDPGCRSLFRKLHLGYLTQIESLNYLDLNGIPRSQHHNIINFAHGHPLALALIADLFHHRPDIVFQPEDEPDIIKTLLALFIQQVPGPAHRSALEIASLVRTISEPLLSAVMDLADVHEIFEWLRSLSFIESGRRGIFPHDLAREALMHDLKWRNPEWYSELHHRIRSFYTARIKESKEEQVKETIFDYIYLHRGHAVVKPFFEWQQSGNHYADTCQTNDLPVLREIIVRHEGMQSCQWFDFWFKRQPESVTVLRGDDHQAVGFVMKLALHLADSGDLESDPATYAVWRYLGHNSPIRDGEKASFFRFWMESPLYQQVTHVQSLIFITMIQHNLRTPSLAYTLFPCAEPAFWDPIMAYADMHRLGDADFNIDDKSFGVFGHDWRKVPPNIWLELMADRELTEHTHYQPIRSEEPLIILNKSEFSSAIRSALRDLDRPDKLVNNPLLRSRMLSDLCSEDGQTADPALILISEIKNVILSLQNSPRDAKYFRVLEKTYIKAARSQEKAAENLNLPFSTYRRHLKSGITRVSDILWQKEVNKS